LKNSTLLYERDKIIYKDCYINIDDKPELVTSIKLILDNKDLPNERHSHSPTEIDAMKAIGKAIGEIWKLDPIQKTFKLRGGRFSFIENMDYFFQKVESVMDFSYLPSDEDVIHARERTAGIIESTFSLNNVEINIVDVGGQRNERSKWIHAFDNVDAVIFVAALNHYNVVLFEDESINAMHESLDLYTEIANGKWFCATELILFLNKRDLFEKELQSGHSLSLCFGENAFGWKGPDFWNAELKEKYDFNKDSENINDPHHFEICFDTALGFIEQRYLQRNDSKSRQVYTHITCATDKNSVDKVFWDIQDIIIRSGLRNNNIL